MSKGTNLHLVRQFNYVAGATQREELSPIQVRARRGTLNYIRGFLVELYLTVTAASTSDAVTARQMLDMLRGLELFDGGNSKFLFDGPMRGHLLRILEGYLGGKAIHAPTAVSANANEVWTRYIPLYIPLELKLLADKRLCMQPAARLEQGIAAVRWSGDGLGTGQTIGSGSFVRLYADVVQREKFTNNAELFLGEKVPTTFRSDKVPLQGHVAFFGVAIPGDTATVATNDFTTVGMQGHDIDVQRGTDIRVSTELYNRSVRDTAAEKTVPGDATTTDFPLIFMDDETQLSDMPLEESLEVSFDTGAGAPAVADQSFIYAVIREKNNEAVAKSLGSSSIKGSSADWKRALDQADQSNGGQGFGGSIGRENPIARFLPTTVLTKFRTA